MIWQYSGYIERSLRYRLKSSLNVLFSDLLLSLLAVVMMGFIFGMTLGFHKIRKKYLLIAFSFALLMGTMLDFDRLVRKADAVRNHDELSLLAKEKLTQVVNEMQPRSKKIGSEVCILIQKSHADSIEMTQPLMLRYNQDIDASRKRISRYQHELDVCLNKVHKIINESQNSVYKKYKPGFSEREKLLITQAFMNNGLHKHITKWLNAKKQVLLRLDEMLLVASSSKRTYDQISNQITFLNRNELNKWNMANSNFIKSIKREKQISLETSEYISNNDDKQ